MPTFKITGPDGKAFNVTGDNAQGALAALQQHLGDTSSQRATAQQGRSWQNDPIAPSGGGTDSATLMTALRNAHNAGDTDAATRIAGMIKAQGGNEQAPQQQAAPAQQEALPWYTPITSAPGNAVDFATGLAKSVMHPVDTFNGLTDLAAGVGLKGLNAVAPRTFQPNDYGQSLTNIADNAGQQIKQNFGSPTAAWNTIATHPIDALATFAPIIGQAGKMADAAGLARTASLLGTASEAANPVSMASGILSKAAPLAGKAITYPMSLLSGASPMALQMAATAGADGGDAAQAFRTAMRSRDDAGSLVADAHSAIDNLAEQRRANYLAGMKGAASSTVTVDTAPIRQTLNDLRDSLFVQPTAAAGDNAASFAPLQKGSLGDLKALNQMDSLLGQWEAHPEGRTPLAVDGLKRRLDELQPAYGNPALDNQRRLVTAMQSAIKDQIVSAEPSYAKAMSDYAGSKTMQKELQTALGLGPRAAADTSFTRLTSAMNGNRADRMANIAQLEQFGAPNLMNRLAGQSVSDVMPKGIVGKLVSAALGGTGYFNPTQLGLLPFTSPRFNAELAHAAGRGSRRAVSLLGNINPGQQRLAQMLLGGQLAQGAGAQ